MATVYILYHYHTLDDNEIDDKTQKLIGVFSTRENAQKVAEERKSKPGFERYPNGFYIYHSEVDGDGGWEEGFASWEEAMAAIPDS